MAGAVKGTKGAWGEECTAASLWLAEHETQLQPRFDVIEIYGDADTPRRQRRINQIENAFE